MLKNSPKFTIMTLEHAGQIGAGKVVPFAARNNTKTIAVPTEFANADLKTFDVCGDSFINENILDGEVLVYRRDFEISEVTPGRLCIVRLYDNELLLKRIYCERNFVRLVSANPLFKDMTYSFEFIEIIGIVVGRPIFEYLS